MDWKSTRIDALLEQALVEDQAVADSTTNLTIDPNLHASAAIIARQELVVAGLGAVPQFFEIFARLDPHPPPRPALKSSAIRRYSTASAFARARCWPSSATMPAPCSVASASSST